MSYFVVFYSKKNFLSRFFSFLKFYVVMCAGIWLNETLFGVPQTCPKLGLGSNFLGDSFFFHSSSQQAVICTSSIFYESKISDRCLLSSHNDCNIKLALDVTLLLRLRNPNLFILERLLSVRCLFVRFHAKMACFSQKCYFTYPY